MEPDCWLAPFAVTGQIQVAWVLAIFNWPNPEQRSVTVYSNHLF
ncbi:MAG: hypothetical protein AAFU84_17590 [Cyanobacteria bacterium J06633_23]